MCATLSRLGRFVVASVRPEMPRLPAPEAWCLSGLANRPRARCVLPICAGFAEERPAGILVHVVKRAA
jgi:hypothetical protein